METFCAEFDYRENFTLYEANKVNIHGLQYDIGYVIVLKTDGFGPSNIWNN